MSQSTCSNAPPANPLSTFSTAGTPLQLTPSTSTDSSIAQYPQLSTTSSTSGPLNPIDDGVGALSLNTRVVDLDLPELASTPSILVNPPKTLADFELLKVLGRGAYGKVFLVRRIRSGELLAMKVMLKREIVKRKVLDNIRAERKVLEGIDHPYLVKLRYAFQTDEKLYLLMKYQAGGEMFAHLDRNGTFVEQHARFYLEEILVAMNYLHTKGIIYRDLKPENVLFQANGHCCLTDFGFAKQFASEADQKTSSFCGSLQYLAPEIVNKQPYDRAIDFWTCGVFLFELLTSRTPFQSTKRDEMLHNIVNRQPKYPKTFSKNCASLLQGLLEKDPQKRLTFEQIKKHPFFGTTNWKDVEAMKTFPPFVPTLKGAEDVSLFDPRFTAEPVIDTPPFTASCVDTSAFRHSSVANSSDRRGTGTIEEIRDSIPTIPALDLPVAALNDNASANPANASFGSTSSHDREGLRHHSLRQSRGHLSPMMAPNKTNPMHFPPPPNLSNQQLSDDDEATLDQSLHPELPQKNGAGLMAMVDVNTGEEVTFKNSIKIVQEPAIKQTTTVDGLERKDSILYTSDDTHPHNLFKDFSFSSESPFFTPRTMERHSMGLPPDFSLTDNVIKGKQANGKVSNDKNGQNSKKDQPTKIPKHLQALMPVKPTVPTIKESQTPQKDQNGRHAEKTTPDNATQTPTPAFPTNKSQSSQNNPQSGEKPSTATTPVAAQVTLASDDAQPPHQASSHRIEAVPFQNSNKTGVSGRKQQYTPENHHNPRHSVPPQPSPSQTFNAESSIIVPLDGQPITASGTRNGPKQWTRDSTSHPSAPTQYNERQPRQYHNNSHSTPGGYSGRNNREYHSSSRTSNPITTATATPDSSTPPGANLIVSPEQLQQQQPEQQQPTKAYFNPNYKGSKPHIPRYQSEPYNPSTSTSTNPSIDRPPIQNPPQQSYRPSNRAQPSYPLGNTSTDTNTTSATANTASFDTNSGFARISSPNQSYNSSWGQNNNNTTSQQSTLQPRRHQYHNNQNYNHPASQTQSSQQPQSKPPVDLFPTFGGFSITKTKQPKPFIPQSAKPQQQQQQTLQSQPQQQPQQKPSFDSFKPL